MKKSLVHSCFVTDTRSAGWSGSGMGGGTRRSSGSRRGEVKCRWVDRFFDRAVITDMVAPRCGRS